jgi:hypothetical protein
MPLDEALRVADLVSPLPQVARQSLQTLAAELHALQRFCGACMATQLGDDLPGDDLQSYAVECGLLQVETMHEPCGEHCACALHSDDWPVECYRRTVRLQRCFAAMRAPA